MSLKQRLPFRIIPVRLAPAFVLAALAAGPISAADEPKPGDASAEAEAFQKYARETAAEYDIRIISEPDRKLVLREEPILRWTNPVGGHQAHGDVFLWTDRGRPEAVLSLYQVTEANVIHEHHEFCSLSLGGLAAERSGKVAWAPAAAGMEMKRFPDAALQGSPRRRLEQMRKLAAQLTADKTTREDVKRDLRLLTQPIYRYEGEHPDLLDGALFAFVEGTDPEVLLLLEARPVGKQYEWFFGAARMNSVHMRVLRGEQTLWDAPVLPWKDVFNRADKHYTALRIR
jgi:hypothetical protein